VFTIGNPDNATTISVTIDEANKTDLDAAMLELGFVFVSEQVPGTATVGETAHPIEAAAVVGDLVYWNTGGAEFQRASAAAAATTPALGVVATKPTAVTANLRASGQIDAMVDDLGGALVPGALYYLSPTAAGKITAVPPNLPGQVVQRLGVALSPSVLLFTVDLDTVTL
jgi:hypothetical protein